MLFPRYYANYDLKHYTRLIDAGEFFAFPRILHGFWEKLHTFQVHHGVRGITESIEKMRYLMASGEGKEVPHHISPRVLKNFHPVFDCYYPDLLAHLASPTVSGLFLAASHLGFTGDTSAVYPACVLKKVIRDTVHPSVRLHDGLLLKTAFIRGEEDHLAQVFRRSKIVAVGMPHLLTMRDHLGLTNFRHVPVNPPAVVDEVVATILTLHPTLGDEPVLYLLQLGGSATACVIYKLWPHLRHNSWLISLGRAVAPWTQEHKVPGNNNQPWLHTIPATPPGESNTFRRKPI